MFTCLMTDGTNIDEFKTYMSKIDSMLSELPYFCADGDLNANKN